jgi:lipopolysaccharide heptosyltransferase III
MKTINQYYRQIRHGTRLGLNCYHNSICLRRLRNAIKKDNPNRALIAINLIEHLGDIVASEPISRYVRQNNPDAFIVWTVKKAYRELIDTNPHINKTLVVHCLTERIMLSESGLFDQVIDLHFQDRYCSLCRKPLRKAETENPIDLKNYFNHGGLLSALAQSAGLPALDESPEVYIPSSSVHRIDSLHLPERFIAINCSSNNPEKDWPASKWFELIDKIIKDHDVHVVELGVSPLVSDSPHAKYIDLCGRLSIFESAEVIRRASLFIGIDSGPAHLANAVGVYGIILMGSYLGFETYNPFSGSYKNGKGSEIIHQRGAVADIPVDRVFQAVSDRLRANNKN